MTNNDHTFVVLAYKESKYLEECIKSVINQTLKTNVIIATSTPNDYIKSLAKKYKLKVKENKGKKGIGYDFDFAIKCAETNLVTIAHQDDIYDKDYSKEILKAYKKEPESLIIFPDAYEIKNNENVYNNLNIRIKKMLLHSLKNHLTANNIKNKRNVIKFGNAISCPSVTFVKNNIKLDSIFASDMASNVDWSAWEKLSKEDGYFYYINKFLMGHRIYQDSTTSKVIEKNGRSEEDYNIFIKFWPEPIAKLLCKIYSLSEKNNKI